MPSSRDVWIFVGFVVLTILIVSFSVGDEIVAGLGLSDVWLLITENNVSIVNYIDSIPVGGASDTDIIRNTGNMTRIQVTDDEKILFTQNGLPAVNVSTYAGSSIEWNWQNRTYFFGINQLDTNLLTVDDILINGDYITNTNALIPAYIGGQAGVVLQYNGADRIQTTSAGVDSKQASWQWYYDAVRTMYLDAPNGRLTVGGSHVPTQPLDVGGNVLIRGNFTAFDSSLSTDKGFQWFANDTNNDYAEVGGAIRVGYVNTGTVIKAISDANDYLQLESSGSGAVYANFNSGSTGSFRAYDGGNSNYVEVNSPVTTLYHTGTSNSGFVCNNANAGSYDCYMQWIAGSTTVTAGIDDSISGDPWVLSFSNALGTTNQVSMTSGVTALVGTLGVGGRTTTEGLTIAKSSINSEWLQFSRDDTRPSIEKGTNFLTYCTSSCDIDRFTNGINGQMFTVMGDDGGNSRFVNQASGSYIYITGVSGANVVLADNEIMICRMHADQTYATCMYLAY